MMMLQVVVGKIGLWRFGGALEYHTSVFVVRIVFVGKQMVGRVLWTLVNVRLGSFFVGCIEFFVFGLI